MMSVDQLENAYRASIQKKRAAWLAYLNEPSPETFWGHARSCAEACTAWHLWTGALNDTHAAKPVKRAPIVIAKRTRVRALDLHV